MKATTFFLLFCLSSESRKKRGRGESRIAAIEGVWGGDSIG